MSPCEVDKTFCFPPAPLSMLLNVFPAHTRDNWLHWKMWALWGAFSLGMKEELLINSSSWLSFTYRYGNISKIISGLEIFWKSRNYCAPRPMFDVLLQILLESTCSPSPATLDCSISGDQIFFKLFLDTHNVSALPKKAQKQPIQEISVGILCFRHSCQEQGCECCSSHE